MPSTSNPLLEAKGITKYFGTITALENVNLKVHAGECLGVAVSYTHLTLPTICSV